MVLLSACAFTSTGQQVRQGVKTYGAQAYDEGLQNAEWFICVAASRGSIMRRYGVSEERAAAYKAFCPSAATDPTFPDK